MMRGAAALGGLLAWGVAGPAVAQPWTQEPFAAPLPGFERPGGERPAPFQPQDLLGPRVRPRIDPGPLLGPLPNQEGGAGAEMPPGGLPGVPTLGEGGAAPARGGLMLVNRDYEAVIAVYVAAPGTESWSELLHGVALPPRGRLAVSLPRGRCVNDVRAVFRDGSSRQRGAMDTCQQAELVIPQGLAPNAARMPTRERPAAGVAPPSLGQP